MEWILTMGMITIGMFGLGKPQLFNKTYKMRLQHIRMVGGVVLICGMLVAISNITLGIG